MFEGIICIFLCQKKFKKIKKDKLATDSHPIVPIAVITVEPAGKASCVYSCMQTRLMDQYNAKSPISLVYGSKPLVTVIRAIDLITNVRMTSAEIVKCWSLIISYP